MRSTRSMIGNSLSTVPRKAFWTPVGSRRPSRAPGNLAHYGTPDAADLAAAYAFDLARNHGFADGNKRVAWVAARLFLADNGYGLAFEPVDAIRTMEGVASGVVSELGLADWFRRGLSPDR